MSYTRQFSADEIIQQQFPFKPPLLKYIFDNINYKHLHKLYQCCKFFPNKFPLIIIHRFVESPSSRFFLYNDENIAPGNVSRIWLSDALNIHTFKPNLSEWISKIWICTIFQIKVWNQDLLLKDFKILTQNGNIQCLDIRNIIDENGYSLAVEEIVAYVSDATQITLSNARVTPETFTKLAALERKCKILYFKLFNVSFELNIDEFLKFMEAQATDKGSEFYIYFGPQFPADFVRSLHIDVKTKIYFQERFKKFTEKPGFACFSFNQIL